MNLLFRGNSHSGKRRSHTRRNYQVLVSTAISLNSLLVTSTTTAFSTTTGNSKLQTYKFGGISHLNHQSYSLHTTNSITTRSSSDSFSSSSLLAVIDKLSSATRRSSTNPQHRSQDLPYSFATRTIMNMSPIDYQHQTHDEMNKNTNEHVKRQVAACTTLHGLQQQQQQNIANQKERQYEKDGELSLSQIIKRTVPPLTSKSHKGSSGRILVLGGSPRYTGAPYYAAMSALRVGSDLASIACAEEATYPIKCYSPELMVEGVYSGATFDKLISEQGGINEEAGEKGRGTKIEIEKRMNVEIQSMVAKVTTLMGRAGSVHAMVIGPGLGRCPMVMKATALIIHEAKNRGIPLVLDADALFMLSLEENHDLLKLEPQPNNNNKDDSEGERQNTKTIIVLTPNIMEYRRLVNSIGEGSEEKLRKSLPGVVIVKKGLDDEIECSMNTTTTASMTCSEEGGLKRSGGIGDILSGTIGTFMAWNMIINTTPQSHSSENYSELDEKRIIDDLILSCWMACCLTKCATREAFQKKKRSMTAPDILEEIGDIVNYFTEETVIYHKNDSRN